METVVGRSSLVVGYGTVHPAWGTTRAEIERSIDSLIAGIEPPFAVREAGESSTFADPPVSLDAILPDAMLPCGKKWYRSKAEAEGEMKRGHMQSTRGPKFKLNSYYCGGCDGYHIGHTRIAAAK